MAQLAAPLLVAFIRLIPWIAVRKRVQYTLDLACDAARKRETLAMLERLDPHLLQDIGVEIRTSSWKKLSRLSQLQLRWPI